MAWFFRFEKSVVGTSLLAGETADYAIKDENDRLLFACRTVGGSTTKPTQLRDADGNVVATLKARRRVMNLNYDFFPGRDRAAVASYYMLLKLRRSWRIEMPPGSSRFAIDDTETLGRSLVRDAMGGSPDVYLVLEGERQIAHIEQTPRPERVPTSGKGLGFLRRAVASVLRPQDWTLLLDRDLPAAETQALIAATLLLQDHTIRLSRSAD